MNYIKNFILFLLFALLSIGCDNGSESRIPFERPCIEYDDGSWGGISICHIYLEDGTHCVTSRVHRGSGITCDWSSGQGRSKGLK